MKGLTRQDILRRSGATEEELSYMEERGLLVANRAGALLGIFGETRLYYTENQLEELRWLVKERRAVQAYRR